MSIKPITPIMFGQNQPYTFDTDTKTLPELCALLHGKMNETITAFNTFETDLMHEHNEFIVNSRGEMYAHETALRQEFQDFIDTVNLRIQDFSNLRAEFNTLVEAVNLRVGIVENRNQHIHDLYSALLARVADLESKVNV